MTLKESKEFVEKCRDRLKLQQWTIVVAWLDKAAQKKLSGQIQWSVEHKSAWLSLAKREKNAERKHSIAHECLHLLIEGHENKTTDDYDPQYEWAVNVLASILVDTIESDENSNNYA